MAQWLTNPTRNHEVAGSIPGVGCRHGSDPELLWLWFRLVATALIRPLAWEPPYAVEVALEKTRSRLQPSSSETQGGGTTTLGQSWRS